MIHGIDTTFLVQVEVREAPGHETARIWLTEALAKHSQPLALAPSRAGLRPTTQPAFLKTPGPKGPSLKSPRKRWTFRVPLFRD